VGEAVGEGVGEAVEEGVGEAVGEGVGEAVEEAAEEGVGEAVQPTGWRGTDGVTSRSMWSLMLDSRGRP
jgi:hypothetical protein